MPLQINDPYYGDKDYYDKRRAMLGELNPMATAATLNNPAGYSKHHAAVVDRMALAKKKYPEQFSDLQEQNTNAKIRALNELDFMEFDPRHTGNPVARLGSQGANTRLRMPMAWADQHPEYGDGRIRGFYTPNEDQLVIPMHTMGTPSGRDTITHETMHRGFGAMGDPTESEPEHNYIYQKMRSNYPEARDYTKSDINKHWESRPGFRYEPEYTQDAFNEKQSTRFEGMARQKLGS